VLHGWRSTSDLGGIPGACSPTAACAEFAFGANCYTLRETPHNPSQPLHTPMKSKVIQRQTNIQVQVNSDADIGKVVAQVHLALSKMKRGDTVTLLVNGQPDSPAPAPDGAELL
jgi:hypothetical protein